MTELILSSLGHTWVLDLDGTIVKHNGYKIEGHDSFLENAEKFLSSIPSEDMIIFITSRTEDYKGITEQFLKDNKIRYDHIIFGAPYGERILLNDRKPSGIAMAYAVNMDRDEGLSVKILIDENM